MSARTSSGLASTHCAPREWLGLFGLPCVAPPWDVMQAIDLVKRKIIWFRPVGATANMGPNNLRGNVATTSGLVFMGATSDQRFRAFDGRTGKTLWETELLAGGNASRSPISGATVASMS